MINELKGRKGERVKGRNLPCSLSPLLLLRQLCLLTGLLLCASYANAQFATPRDLAFWGKSDPCNGGAAPYLIKQNFETPTTGYDHCETWIVTGDSFTPNYTGVVLEGTQSLRRNGTGTGGHITTSDFSDQEEVWVYLLCKSITIDPVNTIELITPRNNIANSRGVLAVLPNGKFFIAGISSSATSVGALTNGGTYHIWFHCKNGPSGVLDAGFSTDGTRPTSGDNFVQITGQAAPPAPTPIVSIRFFDLSYANTEEYILDKVRVDDAQIGDNPP